MSSEPPPFQEAARCDVCKCSFNTFRRRHHCRCCGRTLCHEHSSNQMALPQFGIQSNVRVCSDCFNDSRSGKDDPQASSNIIDAATDMVSRVDITGADAKDHSVVSLQPVVDSSECKCGMPLCICEAPVPALDPDPLKMHTASLSTAQSNPRPKKMENITKQSTVSSSRPSSFISLGQLNNGLLDKPRMDYEATGEGLREAVKNSDIAAVKRLLSEGVDANYCDKQGLSLLHLASLFNQTEIAFILMDYGANLDYKNAQGETPLDCAPIMLQYKMRKKIGEDGA
ncbi:PREDICTED: vacuolar protein sorting-associated protein 27 [Nelumbo nucifera]|uniref:Vacuolar protein sorting-associated protein 27 n=2 Tax=Nelumbo nucifera TaxID=4432 RepID=A0A1U7Z2M8_NELNU|nr:PREDICTED: vacuolar protein sorting-associated protein 27 [Nelumbo nucifera]